MAEDHYGALGVAPDADRATIRAAYLVVIRDHHPDRRPGDEGAAERARRANAAWRVLGHAGRRAAYERARIAVAPVGTGVAHSWFEQADAACSPISPARQALRSALHRASVRAGAVVLATGLLVLLLVAAA